MLDEQTTPRCLSPDCQMGGLGCDNMTCVLVCLLQGKPYQVTLSFIGKSLALFQQGTGGKMRETGSSKRGGEESKS